MDEVSYGGVWICRWLCRGWRRWLWRRRFHIILRSQNKIGDDKSDAKDDASESGRVPSTEPSESSFYATDEDEEAHIELGPKMSIREHLEKIRMMRA
ncbi:hypothetical protein HanPI659440_Chr07g0257731 [Helianthus annuus]|nr:hypothetical protein HanPI659440_Chr07g0257731 [Helianthus annuus]